MGVPGLDVQPVGGNSFEPSVRFLAEWVRDGEREARTYLADHAEPAGVSLVAARGHDVVGYVAIVWESNYAGFRRRGIPLVHQLAVARPFRRRGVATRLMNTAEQLARDRDIATLGITVGAYSTSMAQLSGCMDGAAISLTAGAHARASDRSAKGCRSPSMTA